jgi:hypothetical protein
LPPSHVLAPPSIDDHSSSRPSPTAPSASPLRLVRGPEGSPASTIAECLGSDPSTVAGSSAAPMRASPGSAAGSDQRGRAAPGSGGHPIGANSDGMPLPLLPRPASPGGQGHSDAAPSPRHQPTPDDLREIELAWGTGPQPGPPALASLGSHNRWWLASSILLSSAPPSRPGTFSLAWGASQVRLSFGLPLPMEHSWGYGWGGSGPRPWLGAREEQRAWCVSPSPPSSPGPLGSQPIPRPKAPPGAPRRVEPGQRAPCLATAPMVSCRHRTPMTAVTQLKPDRLDQASTGQGQELALLPV